MNQNQIESETLSTELWQDLFIDLHAPVQIFWI